MLTLQEYFMGRDKEYPDDLTTELRINAQETVIRVNTLLGYFGESREIMSGWRPPAVNAATKGAAPKSKHMTCQAVDLRDDEGDLDEWCLAHPEILEKIGLWQEHPSATKSWAHLQSVPYKSWKQGKLRWFYP